jgi:hypothetical protein
MKKALLGLILLLPSCDCIDYAKADKATYDTLAEDIFVGIEKNPANDEETKELKLALMRSWVFRFESELKKAK